MVLGHQDSAEIVAWENNVTLQCWQQFGSNIK